MVPLRNIQDNLGLRIIQYVMNSVCDILGFISYPERVCVGVQVGEASKAKELFNLP